MFERPPKFFIYAAIVATTVALIPPAVIYWAREINSDKPRIHYIQDMDNQARFKTQQVNDLFRDGRASRPTVGGTVARGEAMLDEHYWKGWVDGDWATEYPSQITIDRALLERGQERYAIYCSMCHGQAGYGDGAVHVRAMELVNNPAIGNGTVWVQPRNIHEAEVRTQPVGQIYNTITNGIRNMAGYAAQIPVEDRWAITAYVQALHRSQNARPQDLDRLGIPAEELPLQDLRPVTEDGGEAMGNAAAAAGTANPTGEGASS
jgi:mono/diheme cytochrome c family protein